MSFTKAERLVLAEQEVEVANKVIKEAVVDRATSLLRSPEEWFKEIFNADSSIDNLEKRMYCLRDMLDNFEKRRTTLYSAFTSELGHLLVDSGNKAMRLIAEKVIWKYIVQLEMQMTLLDVTRACLDSLKELGHGSAAATDGDSDEQDDSDDDSDEPDDTVEADDTTLEDDTIESEHSWLGLGLSYLMLQLLRVLPKALLPTSRMTSKVNNTAM